MKLRELKTLVDRAVETSRDYEDDEVMIAVKLPYTTVGAMPMVPVRSVQRGFDWENGKFIIRAEEELTPADMSEILTFLDRAERYADARGDSKLFKDRYEFYRYDNSIRESIWMALDYLYGEGSANLIEDYTGVEETITKGETE